MLAVVLLHTTYNRQWKKLLLWKLSHYAFFHMNLSECSINRTNSNHITWCETWSPIYWKAINEGYYWLSRPLVDIGWIACSEAALIGARRCDRSQTWSRGRSDVWICVKLKGIFNDTLEAQKCHDSKIQLLQRFKIYEFRKRMRNRSKWHYSHKAFYTIQRFSSK